MRNKDFLVDNPKYSSIHSYIIRKHGKATKCEICGIAKKRYDWSSIDHKYSRDISGWQQLCRSCHIKYDNLNFRMKEIRCKVCGKIFVSPIKKAMYCSEKCKRESIPKEIKNYRHKKWRDKINNKKYEIQDVN